MQGSIKKSYLIYIIILFFITKNIFSSELVQDRLSPDLIIEEKENKKIESLNINMTFFENAIVYLGAGYRFFWLLSTQFRTGFALHNSDTGNKLSGVPFILDLNFYPFEKLRNFQPYISIGMIYLLGLSNVNSGFSFLSHIGFEVKILSKFYIFGNSGIIVSNRTVIFNIGFGLKYYFF